MSKTRVKSSGGHSNSVHRRIPIKYDFSEDQLNETLPTENQQPSLAHGSHENTKPISPPPLFVITSLF